MDREDKVKLLVMASILDSTHHTLVGVIHKSETAKRLHSEILRSLADHSVKCVKISRNRGLVVCPKCRKDVKLRIDGRLPNHKIPRAYRNQKMTLPKCPAAETFLSEWVINS